MRWWNHLYMGEQAARMRPRLLMRIREGSFLPDTYVITLPESGNHILDIRPVLLLTKEERESNELLILGVAVGYTEAAQVVRDMVDDMVKRTGAFDWKAYMELLETDGRSREV